MFPKGTHEEKVSQWSQMMNNLGKNRMGLYPSPPDPRDYDLSRLSTYLDDPPGSSKLLEPPFILDQGGTPFCGGASGAQALNMIYDAHNSMPRDGFSMRFLYWMSKRYDGIPDLDGTYLRSVCKVMKKYGVCRERVLKFENHTNPPEITEEMLEDASGYKIDSYAQLNSMREIKRAIHMGFPVLIGVFIHNKTWNTKDGYLGKPEGDLMGGHAVLLYGYDDFLEYNNLLGYMYGINSWGTRWGDSGKFYMPYEYYDWTLPKFPNLEMFLEAWAVRIFHIPEQGESFFDRPEECPKGVVRSFNCLLQSILRRN